MRCFRAICQLWAVVGLLLSVSGSAAAAGRLLGRVQDARDERAVSNAFPDSAGVAESPAPQAKTEEKTPATPVSASSASTAAPCGCRSLRPGDQIWLISTRCLGCPAENAEPALAVSRYDASGWHSAKLAEFLAADNPAIPTDFYVHGNFETACGAQDNGLTIYSRLVACAAAERPIRFVIWSWPTDPGHHKLQLIREHACRADTDAWYLGWLLNRINPRVPLGLAGYSFGARVVTGAMHLLGDGALCGLKLPLPTPAPKRTVHAVLLAAAEDCYTLFPGQANGNALSVAERMLLLNNSCDKALRLYPHLDRCNPCEALGYVGLGGNYPQVEQLDVCCIVGNEHDWRLYFCNESLVARMRPFLFLESSQPIAALWRDVRRELVGSMGRWSGELRNLGSVVAKYSVLEAFAAVADN